MALLSQHLGTQYPTKQGWCEMQTECNRFAVNILFVKHAVLNERTISEEWTGEYVEGSGRGFGSCVVVNK